MPPESRLTPVDVLSPLEDRTYSPGLTRGDGLRGLVVALDRPAIVVSSSPRHAHVAPEA
jgi:hypothetical protein